MWQISFFWCDSKDNGNNDNDYVDNENDYDNHLINELGNNDDNDIYNDYDHSIYVIWWW